MTSPTISHQRDAHATVSRLRATFNTGTTQPLTWRREQLRALRSLLTENHHTLRDALHHDLRKSQTDSHLTEISFVTSEIDYTLKHLARWVRPQRSRVPLTMRPARAKVVREPLGVVLVIAPFNYPVQLALGPLVGVLAAGNCAVIKPSEQAAATSTELARLVPQYLDTRACAVVEGEIPETTALLEQRFDHIFYTGNGTIGRIIMTAAAQHLTPVTLELGGKSPTVVEAGTNLRTAARRIAWAKFLNAGQTCVAPDYILAVGAITHTLEQELAAAIRAMYGTDPSTSPDYGRIINDRHFNRLAALQDNGRIVVGGQHDRADRYIAPTVLADVDPRGPLMKEEIFGPILPIINVSDLDDAIDFINARDKPLALYAFTGSSTTRRRLVAETSSGVASFGLPVANSAIPSLPFGGVGESGTGRYHGKYSIDTFSNIRAVVTAPVHPDTMKLVYPPHSARKARLLQRLF